MKVYWIKIQIKSTEALFNLKRQLYKTCSSWTYGFPNHEVPDFATNTVPNITHI